MKAAQAQDLDMTSGEIKKDHMIFNLSRKKFNGTMKAHLTGRDMMDITLAVRTKKTARSCLSV